MNYIYAASHRWQGNYTTALEYYDQNYSYFERNNDSLNIAKTARFIGSINMFLGNNVLAQKYLLKCGDIYGEIGTPKQKASIKKSLASFYLNIDQEEKAIEQYLEALEVFTSINDSAGIASCNANLGLTYAYLGEFEKSEYHLMQQKAFNAYFPTLREMGFHYDFMGVLRKEQGRFKEAYENNLKALKIREKLSSTYNLCESKLSVGSILIKLGRYQEAIGHLKPVLDFEEHQSNNQQLRAYNLLSEAYEKKGNYVKALDYFKSYKAVSDSIYDQESIQVIAEKDAKYQKQEQDAEIALLSKEKVIAQQKLNRSKILFYGTLIGLIIISFLSFIVYRLYLKIKGKNQIIKQALEDKNLLIHEIHHRVKNNLQIISSLLKLQSRFITDENALEAIKDGRNRVQSMAVVHRNLYQEDEITGVNMKKYFTSLIEGIFKSYNLAKEDIKLNLDIDDLHLDIDTVIPIGLITNELITNSLKYAFENGTEHALIEVKLKESINQYALTVKDNGVGMNEQLIKQESNKSFGQKMIKTFAQKLKADIQVNNLNGTEVTINIPR